MDTTYYRISDRGYCGQILANNIPDLTQAQKILELLRKDYPDSELTIESYSAKS